MRKIMCFVLSVFGSLMCANAQFVATKEGVQTVDGKDFYIVEIEGKTAQQLFDSVEAYIIANFKNPDAVANVQEGKMINMHGVFSQAFPCRKWAGMHYADVDLNLVMYFKDSKIRFDIPVINSMICRSLRDNNGRPVRFYFDNTNTGGAWNGAYAFFDKKGNVKNELAVAGFNEFVSSLITDIVDYVTEDAANADW